MMGQSDNEKNSMIFLFSAVLIQSMRVTDGVRRTHGQERQVITARLSGKYSEYVAIT